MTLSQLKTIELLKHQEGMLQEQIALFEQHPTLTNEYDCRRCKEWLVKVRNQLGMAYVTR